MPITSGPFVDFFKKRTKAGIWFSCVNGDGKAPYLFRELGIDSLSEEQFKRFLKEDRVVMSHTDGVNSIWVRKFQKCIHIAHTSQPTYAPGDAPPEMDRYTLDINVEDFPPRFLEKLKGTIMAEKQESPEPEENQGLAVELLKTGEVKGKVVSEVPAVDVGVKEVSEVEELMSKESALEATEEEEVVFLATNNVTIPTVARDLQGKEAAAALADSAISCSSTTSKQDNPSKTESRVLCKFNYSRKKRLRTNDMNRNSATDRHSEHGHSVLSNQYLEDKTAVSPGASSSLFHSGGCRVGAAGQCCLSADVIQPQDQPGFCKHCHVAISVGEICFECFRIKTDFLPVGYQCAPGEVQYAAQKTTKLNPSTAASLFASGECPVTLSIADYSVDVPVHKATSPTENPPMCDLQERFLASQLRTYEQHHSQDGAICPWPGLNRGRKRTYSRQIVGNKDTVQVKQLRRHSIGLKRDLVFMSNGNVDRMARIIGKTMRATPEVLKDVIKYAGVPLHDQMTPLYAASMIEDANINAASFMKVRMWLEACFPSLQGCFPSKQRVRRLVMQVSSAIAMKTGTMTLEAKKNKQNKKTVEAPFVRVLSVLQAFLVTLHENFLAGKRQLEGAPKGEVWGQNSADAGGGRNNFNHKWLLANNYSNVQSIREITTLCIYSATGAVDNYHNHKIAFWDPLAADLNRISSDTTAVCEVILGGEYIASIFLEDVTSGYLFNPTLIISEITTEKLEALTADGQTWIAPGPGVILALLTSENYTSIVGIVSVTLPDLGSPDDSRRLFDFLFDTSDFVEPQFGEKFRIANVNFVTFDDSLLSFKIQGAFIFPNPVSLMTPELPRLALLQGELEVNVELVREFSGGDGKYMMTCVNGCTGGGVSPCQDCEMPFHDFNEDYAIVVAQKGPPVKRELTRICEQATSFQNDMDKWEKGIIKAKPMTKNYGSCEYVPALKVQSRNRCLGPLHYTLKVVLMLYNQLKAICTDLDGQSATYTRKIKERDEAEALRDDLTQLVDLLKKKVIPALKEKEKECVDAAKAHFRTSSGKPRKTWSEAIFKKTEELVVMMPDGFDKVHASALLNEITAAADATKEKEDEVECFNKQLATLKDFLEESDEDGGVTPGLHEECLSETLKKPISQGGLGVIMRKHQGENFVGDDAKKICERTDGGGSDIDFKERVYRFDVLFAAVRTTLTEQTRKAEVTAEKAKEAEIKMDELRQIFAEWAEIQRVMRITRFLYEDEIAYLEKHPAKFVSLVRKFMGGIGKSKKLHEIEAHLGEFARRNRCVYLLAEEGAESKHAEFNMRNRVYCRIQNMSERLAVMTEMERFANSDLAQAAGSLVRDLKETKKRGKYKPRASRSK